MSSRESSSDSSSDYRLERGANNGVNGAWSQPNIADANIQGLKRLSLRNKTLTGSSSDESENCSPPGQLVFEYFEYDPPFSREPLADKASPLSLNHFSLQWFFFIGTFINRLASNRFKFLQLGFQN